MRTLLVILMFILFGCDETQGYWDLEDAGTEDTDSDTETEAVDTDCSEDGICDNPPDNFCSEDGTQFISYLDPMSGFPSGTCADGICSYATWVEDCTIDEWEGDCILNPTNGNSAQCMNPCYNYDCSNYDDYCYYENQKLFITEGIPFCHLEGGNPACVTSEGYSIDCPNGCIVVEDGPDYCAE